MNHTLFKVNALQAAGIEYVPVPRDHIDRLEMEMMLGFMQKDIILNSIDTNFQIAGAEEFWKLIDSLINQNVELNAEHVAAAKAKDLQNYNFLYDIAPDLNKIIQDAVPDIEAFTKQFYDTGKAQGFSDLDVKSFTGASDTNALFHLTNYNYDLIRNVNEDIVRGVRQRVWQGVARGRSNKEIERQIRKLPLQPIPAGNRMLSPAQRSKLIAHTESSRGRHQGVYMSYKQYDVNAYNLENTPWKRLCKNCKSLAAENPYKIDDLTAWPPIHPLCHCGTSAASDPADNGVDPGEFRSFVTGEVEKVNPNLVLSTSNSKISKQTTTLTTKSNISKPKGASYNLESVNKETRAYIGKQGNKPKAKAAEFTVHRYTNGKDSVDIAIHNRAGKLVTPEETIKAYESMPQKLRDNVGTIHVMGNSTVSMGYHVKIKEAPYNKGIYVYNHKSMKDPNEIYRTISHEAGHSYSWNNAKDVSEWENAIKVDSDNGLKQPTSYSKTSAEEDFCESVSLYVADSKRFAKEFPGRAQELKRIFGSD